MKGQSPVSSFWRPSSLLATWFGSGLLPLAPGTWGSLAALPCAWVIVWAGGTWALIAATVVVALLGWWAAEVYAAATGRDDPGAVVIDEVAGQWLVLLPAGTDITLYIAGFVLFRIFDITKPWPAIWADRNLHGGLGIMLDDLLAAGYGLVALLALKPILAGL